MFFFSSTPSPYVWSATKLVFRVFFSLNIELQFVQNIKNVMLFVILLSLNILMISRILFCFFFSSVIAFNSYLVVMKINRPTDHSTRDSRSLVCVVVQSFTRLLRNCAISLRCKQYSTLINVTKHTCTADRPVACDDTHKTRREHRIPAKWMNLE